MRQTGCSVPEYLDFYEDQWFDLFGDDKTSHVYKSIRSAWKLSFGYIKQGNESAAKLLLLWAHLDNANISYEFLASSLSSLTPLSQSARWFPEWFRDCINGKLAFLKLVNLLVDHSLIEATVQAGCYSMHPLLHEWCYHSLAGEKGELTWLATITLACAIENQRFDSSVQIGKQLLPHCDRLHRHIDSAARDEVEDKGRLMLYYASIVCVGRLYLVHQQIEKVEKMYTASYNRSKKSSGVRNPRTLCMGDHLALIYICEGKLEEAEEVIMRVLAGRDSADAQDPLLQRSLNTRGLLYKEQKKWKEAEETFLRVSEARTEKLGEIYPQSEALNHLGALYRSTGRIHEAEVMYNRALEVKKERFGTDNNSTLTTVAKLADLHLYLKNLEKAEALYMRALRGYSKIWGPNHVTTLDSVSKLAYIYQNMTRYDDAEELFRRAEIGYTEWFGPSHKKTLAIGVCLKEISTLRVKASKEFTPGPAT
jgi:tetratricopeptide (TPR) repeat protein